MRDNIGMHLSFPRLPGYTGEAIEILSEHVSREETSLETWEALSGLEYINLGGLRCHFRELRVKLRNRDFLAAREMIEGVIAVYRGGLG